MACGSAQELLEQILIKDAEHKSATLPEVLDMVVAVRAVCATFRRKISVGYSVLRGTFAMGFVGVPQQFVSRIQRTNISRVVLEKGALARFEGQSLSARC